MMNRNLSVSQGRKIKIHRIHKIFLLLLIFFLTISFFVFFNNSNIFCSPDVASLDAVNYGVDIDINAESAVIIDYRTGDILWEKNSSARMYPASLTKMLSAIIAIENIDDFYETVEISDNAAGRNHSSFTFRTGDEISLIDLLKAALISSHNNAAIAIAEHVSGNLEDFVVLMNTRAVEIGARDSSFENPNGLDDEFPLHISNSIDMAKIASYCMKNELFSKIVNISKDKIKVNEKEIEITNTNDLLEDGYIKGIKTGHTNNAGFCMAIYSIKDNIELITVVLNSDSESERDRDINKLLDWAYNNIEYVKIVDSNEPALSLKVGNQTKLDVELYPEKDYIGLINKNRDEIDFENNVYNGADLPVGENEILGSESIFVNGREIGEINLVSHESISKGYIHQDLTTSDYRQKLFIIVLLMVFYFLIIITIIVKNLLQKRFL
jgi:serine-type D-Ala-D-Ala carboxypeptidase (penicillin-binding protein 5/6)